MNDANWNQRLIGIVPERYRAIASQVLVDQTGNQEDLKSFSIPLSSTGIEPITHWGCSSACHEALRSAIADQLTKKKISAQFIVLEHHSGDDWQIIRSSSSKVIRKNLSDNPIWKIHEIFAKAIEVLGLKVVIISGENIKRSINEYSNGSIL